jgi:hypothetical protein
VAAPIAIRFSVFSSKIISSILFLSGFIIYSSFLRITGSQDYRIAFDLCILRFDLLKPFLTANLCIYMNIPLAPLQNNSQNFVLLIGFVPDHKLIHGTESSA